MTKTEIMKAIIKAIELEKNCTSIGAKTETQKLGLTANDVMSVIDEEYITWVSDRTDECIAEFCRIEDMASEYLTASVSMIEEYNDGLYNVYISEPYPLENEVAVFCIELNAFRDFVDDNFRKLDFCDLPIGHELLLKTTDIVEMAKQLVIKMENLD